MMGPLAEEKDSMSFVKVAVAAAVSVVDKRFLWLEYATTDAPFSALLGPTHIVIVRHAWVRCH